jgi:hypothetical protein
MSNSRINFIVRSSLNKNIPFRYRFQQIATRNLTNERMSAPYEVINMKNSREMAFYSI